MGTVFSQKVFEKALGDSMWFTSHCRLVPESSAEWVPLNQNRQPKPVVKASCQNKKAFYLTYRAVVVALLKYYDQFWSIKTKRL